MKIASQVLLRLAVLLGFNIKFVLCMIRNQSILILSGRRFLCRLQPVIELLSSVVLVLMTCLHQEQDQSVKWLMPYNFPMFSCLFILGGIMYLNLDVIDLSKKFSAIRFSVQLSCLLAYCICAPTVHSSLLQFLKERPCHVYVPYQAAMAEYVCLSSFLMFSASQLGDLHGLRIVVPSLPDSPTINSSTRYSPAFLAPESSPENSVKVSLSC